MRKHRNLNVERATARNLDHRIQPFLLEDFEHTARNTSQRGGIERLSVEILTRKVDIGLRNRVHVARRFIPPGRSLHICGGRLENLVGGRGEDLVLCDTPGFFQNLSRSLDIFVVFSESMSDVGSVLNLVFQFIHVLLSVAPAQPQACESTFRIGLELANKKAVSAPAENCSVLKLVPT